MAAGMKVTYYGHSCFAAQVANKTLLFDTFITGNELAKAIDVDKVPADYILISHGHADHMADAAGIAKRTGATIVWAGASNSPTICCTANASR